MLTEAVRVLAQVNTCSRESAYRCRESTCRLYNVEALMMLVHAFKVVCRGCWRASKGCKITCPGHLVLVRAVRMLTEVVKVTVEAVVASVQAVKGTVRPDWICMRMVPLDRP
jgi:hypothetical protein